MSERKHSQSIAHLWWRNGLIWLALLVLLLTSFGTAYIPLGPWNMPIGIGIAFVKAGLVAALFMELKQARALIRLACAAGFFIVFILYGLTTIDVLMRLNNQ